MSGRSRRVLRGDVRQSSAGLMLVLRTERGRAGEERTMVVVGHYDREAEETWAAETRSHRTVSTWPLVRRLRLGPVALPGEPTQILAHVLA